MPERLSLRTRRRANERNFGTKSQLQYISKSKTFREEGLAFILLSPALHVNFGAGSVFMRDWPKPCASVACLSLFLIFSDIVEFTVDKAAQSVWTAGRGVWSAWCGVRVDGGCGVRSAWCADGGAWCAVGGAWCAVGGAWCAVGGAWCAVGVVWCADGVVCGRRGVRSTKNAPVALVAVLQPCKSYFLL